MAPTSEVPLTPRSGFSAGALVGVFVGAFVGLLVGGFRSTLARSPCLAFGWILGQCFRWGIGWILGRCFVGELFGLLVEAFVGAVVGAPAGALVGLLVGAFVGFLDGSFGVFSWSRFLLALSFDAVVGLLVIYFCFVFCQRLGWIVDWLFRCRCL